MSIRRLGTALVLSAGLLFPVALAAPASAALPCAWSDPNTDPWNYPIDDVACVVLSTANGIRLVGVTDLQPGWSYDVRSAGGGTKGVEIRFSNLDGRRIDFRFAPGKTKIG